MFRFRKGSESDLIRRVLSGRHDQFEELVRRHMPMAEAIAMSRLRNVQDAEDIVQESFLKAYHRLDTLREQNQFGVWLAVIVRNACTNFQRRQIVEEPISDTIPASESLHARIELEEALSLVRARLDDLRENDREILFLHYFAGKPTAEIADILHISRDAVKKRLQRAREALGSELLRDIKPRPDDALRRNARVLLIIGAIPLSAAPWSAHAATSTVVVTGAGGLAKVTGAIAVLVMAIGMAPFAVGGCDAWSRSKPAAINSTIDGDGTDGVQRTASPPDKKVAPVSTTGGFVPFAPIPETGDGSVSGVVTFAKGNRLASGVSVLLDAGVIEHYPINTGHGRTAVTSKTGSFQFKALVPNTYTVRVDGPNAFPFVKFFELEESADLNFAIVLEEMATVSGRVFHKVTGTGVAGVRVFSESGEETISAADGSYRLSGLREGRLQIRRGATGSYAHPIEGEDKRLQVEAGDVVEGIDFPLSEGITIHGLVVDENNQPMPNIDFRFGIINSPLQLTIVSDDEGKIVVPNMPKRYKAWYDLHQRSREQGLTLPFERKIALEDEDISGLLIKPLLGALVSGQIVTPEGKGIAGISIGMVGTTDANGAFSSRPIYPGTYTLTMEFPAKSGIAAPPQELETITLRPGETRSGLRYVYEPESGLNIAGHILDTEGNPLGGVSFAVMSEAHQTRATTDKDGAFRIEGLQEGVYQLAYFDYGNRTYYDGEQVAAGEQDVEIRLKLETEPAPVSGGPIAGHVIDAQTREPIKSFGYELRPGIYQELDPAAKDRTGFWDIRVPLTQQVTDKEGAFSFPSYASGPHSLMLMASGYAPYACVVKTGSSGVVIAMQPGARVEGSVLDAAGQPVANAFIIRGTLEYFHMIGMLEPNRAKVLAMSDRDGKFRIDDFGGDALLLSAVHMDHGIVSQSVNPASVGSDGILFAFPPTGGFHGAITLGGAPGARCGFAFEENAQGIQGNFWGDEAGNYHIAGVPPGRYPVRFSVYDKSSANQIEWFKTEDVDVAAGEPAEWSVDFPEATSSMTGVATLDGKPISVVSTVRIEYPLLGISSGRDVSIKPDGTYTIDRLPAGDAVIRFPESCDGVEFDRSEVCVFQKTTC